MTELYEADKQNHGAAIGFGETLPDPGVCHSMMPAYRVQIRANWSPLCTPFGLLHVWAKRRSLGLSGWCGHACVEFDWGQSAGGRLAVVRLLDTGDARDPQFFSVDPESTVRNDLLRHVEEGLHGGAAASCTKAAH